MIQKEVVFTTTMKVLGGDFKEGLVCSDFFKSHPKKKEELVQLMTESLENGEWTIKSEKANENVTQYINSVIANFFRRDTRLNGGTEYVAVNPGSKTGSRDPKIKNMKLLLATQEEGSEAYDKIKAKIEFLLEEARELKASKEIDATVLDPEFQAMIPGRKEA